MYPPSSTNATAFTYIHTAAAHHFNSTPPQTPHTTQRPPPPRPPARRARGPPAPLRQPLDRRAEPPAVPTAARAQPGQARAEPVLPGGAAMTEARDREGWDVHKRRARASKKKKVRSIVVELSTFIRLFLYIQHARHTQSHNVIVQSSPSMYKLQHPLSNQYTPPPPPPPPAAPPVPPPSTAASSS